jgi:hypothetical protein
VVASMTYARKVQQVAIFVSCESTDNMAVYALSVLSIARFVC